MNEPFNITAGFEKDCATLIERFNKVDDIRFKSFCDIWKDSKFSLIFKGKERVSELMEFCEETLRLVKQYLFVGTFKDRICGLYLLYGIYFKLPCVQFKIRVTQKEWQMIMELHNEIKEGEHHDANYILSKLIVNNAFIHCLSEQEISFEKSFRKKYCYHNNYSVSSAITDMIEKDLIFEKLNKFSKAYQQKKSEIFSDNKNGPRLNLFNSDVADEIVNDIYNLNRNMEFDKELDQSKA
ncbi:hypothetical protein M0802_010257 [Mischocyttarus mexicanus]|nr:hypothetical protein M0802_010257 [Mischocyttarus mexicanus]